MRNLAEKSLMHCKMTDDSPQDSVTLIWAILSSIESFSIGLIYRGWIVLSKAQ
jgi:hypothetical protein